MALHHYASYEVPSWLREQPLLIDVLSHNDLLVQLVFIFEQMRQAAFYPPPALAISCQEAELACRHAIGQFSAKTFHFIRQERRHILRRPAYYIDLEAKPYDGILLSHPISGDERESIALLLP